MLMMEKFWLREDTTKLTYEMNQILGRKQVISFYNIR